MWWLCGSLAVASGPIACNLSHASTRAERNYIGDYEAQLSKLHSFDALMNITVPGVLCEPQFDPSVTQEQRAIINSAHRQLQLFLPRQSSACHRIQFVTHGSNNGNTLALAWPGNQTGNNIELFPLALEHNNLLFHVAQHEILHIVGYNNNANSFTSRIDPFDRYTSNLTKACVARAQNVQQNTVDIRVDMHNGFTTGHWAVNQYGFDLMTPYVRRDSNLYMCSVVAAAENSLFAGSPNVCSEHADCSQGMACTTTTETNPNACYPSQLHGLNGTVTVDSRRFPVFTAFYVTLAIFLKLLIFCAKVNDTVLD